MIQNLILEKRIIAGLLVVAVLFLSSSSCSDDATGSNGSCTKCIDNKPAPTPFSTTLNAINHSITIEQAMTMIQNFETNKDSMLNIAYRGSNILPLYETFNLKAIDSLICQKNAVGFRIYTAMDAQQQVRFVLVGVDGDGKDIIQRKQENPGRGLMDLGDVSVLVEEAGQRWP